MSQQPHKNHTAIPRQSHSKMSSNINIALVHNKSTTIHLDAAARHSKTTASPQQYHGNPKKFRSNITATPPDKWHSNPTAIKGKDHTIPTAL